MLAASTVLSFTVVARRGARTQTHSALTTFVYLTFCREAPGRRSHRPDYGVSSPDRHAQALLPAYRSRRSRRIRRPAGRQSKSASNPRLPLPGRTANGCAAAGHLSVSGKDVAGLADSVDDRKPCFAAEAASDPLWWWSSRTQACLYLPRERYLRSAGGPRTINLTYGAPGRLLYNKRLSRSIQDMARKRQQGNDQAAVEHPEEDSMNHVAQHGQDGYKVGPGCPPREYQWKRV
jgi:hypothetical protein